MSGISPKSQKTLVIRIGIWIITKAANRSRALFVGLLMVLTNPTIFTIERSRISGSGKRKNWWYVNGNEQSKRMVKRTDFFGINTTEHIPTSILAKMFATNIPFPNGISLRKVPK